MPRCTRTRARSCCSWAASSGSGASGTTRAGSTGTCSTTPRPAVITARCAISYELNRTLRAHPALHQIDDHWDGFEWIDYADVEQSVLAYARHAKERVNHVVAIANYTPVTRTAYRVGVPGAGPYAEILNSDARAWGGSGVSNPSPLPTEPIVWQGQQQSLVLTLPPLSVLYLAPVPS